MDAPSTGCEPSVKRWRGASQRSPGPEREDEEQPGGGSGTPVRPERPEGRAARKEGRRERRKEGRVAKSLTLNLGWECSEREAY